MSPVQVKTEALTALELRWVRRSRFVHLSLLVIASIACMGILLFAVSESELSSSGEIVFSSAVALLTLAGSAMLAHLAVGIWRDVGSSEKIVVRGKVSSVHRRSSSYGMHYSIRVGEEFVASDPLYSPIPGFIARVQVGEVVEVSFLRRSRRTLSVIPA
jgi:hypothetical protein